MTRLRINTPSRLHFGLLGWGPQVPRQFGGVGLMLERPGLEIVAETAPTWEADGPLADRALDVAVLGALVGVPLGTYFLSRPEQVSFVAVDVAEAVAGIEDPIGVADRGFCFP